MTRLLFILLLLALLAPPALAQEAPPRAADFVPATFAAVLELDTRDAVQTLDWLNEAAQAAYLFQPGRVPPAEVRRLYYDLIPFAALFDVETSSFVETILPWLGGDMALAYRDFSPALRAEPADTLLILASEDLLDATSRLASIIRAQDAPAEREHRGVPIYIGDEAAIAVTTPAVFIGPLDLVMQALDVQAGARPALTAEPAYRAIAAERADDAFLNAYVAVDYGTAAVNAVLNGALSSPALLEAFGGALAALDRGDNLEQALLSGGYDALGLSLRHEDVPHRIIARLSLPGLTAPAPAPASEALLAYLPQGTLLAGQGESLRALVNDGLALLPMARYLPRLYAGLPYTVTDAGAPAPTPTDARAAVDSFAAMLEAQVSFDLRDDLLAPLDGPYALALLPRPNNPLPGLNLPFDILVAAEPADADAARAGLEQAFELLLGYTAAPLDSEVFAGWDARAIGVDAAGMPLFITAVRDGRLLLASGDAAERALAAASGDDRLIGQPGWAQAQTGEMLFYLDTIAFYNTFFPLQVLRGGVVVDDAARTRLGIAAPTSGTLPGLEFTVTLPQG